MQKQLNGRLKVQMLLGITLSIILAASLAPKSYAMTDCSTIPAKNLHGVVFMDGTLSRNEGSGKASVLTSFVTENLKYIRLSGFNTIRVPYYWEAYVNDPTAFMGEIDLIAKQAQANNLCVIYDNHHYYTTSYWKLDISGKSGGHGFPSAVVKNFPAKNNDYIDTAGPFWNAFLSNSFSVGGMKVWDYQFNFFKQIIKKVDSYPSTAGYEILNEPHLFKSDQYSKLGDYHTYMAKKIRSISDKKIFFDRETTRGFSRDPSKEPLIFPTGVSKIVYGPHLYSVPNPGSQGLKQIKNIANWAASKHTEVLIGEWGADTKTDMITFLKTFKAYNFGWTAHSWKKSGSGGLGMSVYDSSSTSPTSDLKNLMDAMAAVY